MGRSLKGESVEEQKIALLLGEALKSADVKPVKLAALLRPEQFLSGNVPSRATIYRRLRGERLVEDGSDLIEAILDLCPASKGDEIRQRIFVLLAQHHENPTPLPSLNAEQGDSVIAELRRDLEQAEREKASMLKAAARRAEAERIADALRPPDPNAEAQAIIERLTELRAAGRHDEVERTLVEIAKDAPAEVLVALLGRLEGTWKASRPRWWSVPGAGSPRDMIALATAVGRHRYYKELPEITLGLDRQEAVEAWEISLREAGSRHFDALVWLYGVLRSPGYSGSGLLLNGAGQYAHITTWKELWYSGSHYDINKIALINGAVAKRSTDDLLEVLRKTFGLYEWEQHHMSLEEAVGRYRPVESFAEVLGWIQGWNRHPTVWNSGSHTLLTAGRDRAPKEVVALVAALRQAGQDENADEMLAIVARERNSDPTRYWKQGVNDMIAAFREVGQSQETDKLLAALARERNPRSFTDVVKVLKQNKQNQDMEALLTQASKQRRSRRRALVEAFRDQGMRREAEKIVQPWWLIR